MNFLAHSLMGFDDTELVAGQFCGDFVRGSQLAQFPGGIERGIRLHRHLDVFIDAFPALQPIRQDIDSGILAAQISVPRRFIGIVIDVLFDHHLARYWDQVSERTLGSHVRYVHAALDEHHTHLPDDLKRFLRLLKQEQILEGNLQIESIELTLERISRRSPRLHALAIPTEQLLLLREHLEGPFELFFPALRQAAVTYLAQYPVSETQG